MGELGVGGEWKDRPIQLYGAQLGSALGYAMHDALQADPAGFGKTMRGLPLSAAEAAIERAKLEQP